VCETPKGQVADILRTVEPLTIELEYRLEQPIKGLRVGIYLMTTRGNISSLPSTPTIQTSSMLLICVLPGITKAVVPYRRITSMKVITLSG